VVIPQEFPTDCMWIAVGEVAGVQELQELQNKIGMVPLG
jgi:hypothetical protein